MIEQNVGKMYDTWMNKQADEYWSSCEPEVVDVHKEYSGTDENGSIEVSTEYIYNCSQCDNTECGHWNEFNE